MHPHPVLVKHACELPLGVFVLDPQDEHVVCNQSSSQEEERDNTPEGVAKGKRCHTGKTSDDKEYDHEASLDAEERQGLVQ